MYWPLNKNNFTWLDRLKICKFFLNPKNRWTQDKFVREYEEKLAEYVGCNYAVFVSSGSSANQLLAQYVKDDLIDKGFWTQKNMVIFNSVTWQTNCSVWIREGFTPIFIDVSLDDFCMDYDKLERFIKFNRDKIACVFPTSVLGFTPNIKKLINISNKYNIKIYLDNCENFLGEYLENEYSTRYTSVCRPFTCSTSCFFAHHITSGSESGVIFTNNIKEYEYFLLSRAHGLLRNLNQYNAIFPTAKHNSLVDSNFDFQTLSSNFRATDIQAFMALLNFETVKENKENRIRLYNIFWEELDKNKYYLPPVGQQEKVDVPFCLPIILNKNNNISLDLVKLTLKNNNIEYRPFISGNILRQKPYQKYNDYRKYNNAEYLNNYACYVGLYQGLKEKDILFLTEILNNL